MAKVLFVISVPSDNDLKSSFENEEICKEEKGSQELKCTNDIVKENTEDNHKWDFDDQKEKKHSLEGNNNSKEPDVEIIKPRKNSVSGNTAEAEAILLSTHEDGASKRKNSLKSSQDNIDLEQVKRKNSLLDADEVDKCRSTRKNSISPSLASQKIDMKMLKKSESGLVSFLSLGPLIDRVKATLLEINVTGVQWNTTEDNLYVGTFIDGDGERCEEILYSLTEHAISVSVFPASVSITRVPKKDEVEQLKKIQEKESILAEKVGQFKKSIKSRLVVAQVVDSVKSDALFTFDFLMLVMLASMVAVMGLLEASSVALVASMLVSPLMGPIIAGVFGTVIRNHDLLKVGFKSEIKGLCLCILMGFVTGFIPAALESTGAKWRSTENWPTIEMSARGSLRSLLVGVLIAIPSGAGVALSILGGKVGSLVGVAISASLLPPAVNAGLLWANALVVAIRPPATLPMKHAMNDSLVNGTADQRAAALTYKGELKCPEFIDNGFIPEYYCDMARESAVLGVVSLLLTILNIICIIIMGIVVLKIKEVAPIRSGPTAEKEFFGEDLKIARESYQTTKGQYSQVLGKKFSQEWENLKNAVGVDGIGPHLHDIVEEVEESATVKEITDLMPHKPKPWSDYFDEDSHHSEKQYKTIGTHFLFPPRSNDEFIEMRKPRPFSHSESYTRDDDDAHSMTYLTIHRSTSPRSSVTNKTVSKPHRFEVVKVQEKSPKKRMSRTQPSSPVPKPEIKINLADNATAPKIILTDNATAPLLSEENVVVS
ncbi:uncharacterized protein LOC131955573 isoform X2 [Physella acuta]|uniref:uncharacterized protein LOC131955573 isoform X2 n=1 Tax=Physella acuta TaxID=109671 RepID=UPI0027DB2E5D|nr:uncharacterized protein LOC131955573 isoform X2 [Physella acuta]